MCTIRYDIFTCAQKLSLAHGTETKKAKVTTDEERVQRGR